jgi:hypothetical protein
MGKSKPMVPAESTDTFDLTIELVDGPSVVISVTYPKGQGLAAIKALAAASSREKIPGLLYALKHDPSVQAYMTEQGIGFADEDDDY